jgi:DnaK suppressor protein
VTSKAVKTAKPVQKNAGKAVRAAAGATAKKAAVKLKAVGSVKSVKKAPAPAVKKKAASKAAGKPAKKPALVKPKSAPAKSTPVKSAPAKPAQVKSTPVKSAQVKSAQVKAAAPKTKVGKAPAPVAKPKTAAPAAQPPVKPKTKSKQNAAPIGGTVAAPVHRVASAAPHVQSRPTVNHRARLLKKDPGLATRWKTKPVEQWSDDEAVCMPDDEYMNDKQLAFFRLRLLRLKNDILANAGETTEHLRSDTVVVPDPADRATIEEEHALELRTRDRERKLLRKIEQSIARIDAGDYGYCDETGEQIGVARLLARPTATLSLEAQQRRELKQKMFGD